MEEKPEKRAYTLDEVNLKSCESVLKSIEENPLFIIKLHFKLLSVC